MISSVLFWLVVACFFVTCIAAIAGRSLAEFSRHELEEICRRHKSSDRLSQILKKHDRLALAAESIRVLASISFVLAVLAFAEEFVGESLGTRVSIYAAAVLLLVSAEIWLPWTVARLWAARFVYFTWPLWQVVAYLAAPLVIGARIVDVVVHRLAGRVQEVPDEESFEDEIRTIVTEGHREGLLEEDAREMIEGVIELSDVEVSQIMTPRTEMSSMPLSLSWQEMLDFVVRVGHTRIPVYDVNRDDIMGILYVKDLLPLIAQHQGEPASPWHSLLREPCFVPETKPVDVLLQEFQRNRSHMVVVLDEYGGVSGLVSMEDVLEEIVGEIIDEYDKDLVEGIREVDAQTIESLGKVHIDEINERLAIRLPEDRDFDTIGGFVFAELGHIPIVGEEHVWNNVRLTVVEATRRRIERVRIELLDQSSRETA